MLNYGDSQVGDSPSRTSYDWISIHEIYCEWGKRSCVLGNEHGGVTGLSTTTVNSANQRIEIDAK